MGRDGFRLNRSQRMQLKAFVCVLGILFIIILLVAKIIIGFLHKEAKEEQPVEPYVPIVQVLNNVWILEEDENGILVFRDGERENYPWGMTAEMKGEDVGEAEERKRYRPEINVREQLADVTLTDGYVTEIVVKSEKINGRILSAEENCLEVEGYGKLPLAEDYKGYRLYDSLQMCSARDICFGYNFTDLCIENGEICGILMVKEEAMEYIRVLIKNSDDASVLHAQPVITADTDFTVVYGNFGDRKSETHSAGEEISFSYDSPYFEGERVLIIPEVLTGRVILKSVNKNQGIPSYRGRMELVRTQEGIAVINEVLLEEYLYSVVPSEMPAGYPEEALKAQAVCARTYAYGHMQHAGYPQYGAHVDDSTSYQVYNNIAEQESTTTAVKETYGQLLYTEDNNLAETYYYSTSCGVGSDANVWKTKEAPLITYLRAKSLSKTAMAQTFANSTEDNIDNIGEKLREEEAFKEFISSVNEDDFEAKESWYRWSYEVKSLDPEYLLERLKKRYAVNSRLILTLEDGEYVSRDIGELGKIKDICIEKRGAGGVADELVIVGDEGTYKVISEHNIRYVLNNGESKIYRMDGSEVAGPNLLPSGFFVITTGKKEGNVVGYTLTGGGYGHGVGMSQNGAKEMAKCGFRAEDILLFFYEDCYIKSIYE